MKKYILLFALLLSACNLPGSVPETESAIDEAVGDAPQTEAVTQTENNPPVDAQPAAPLPAGPVHIVALGDSLTPR